MTKQTCLAVYFTTIARYNYLSYFSKRSYFTHYIIFLIFSEILMLCSCASLLPDSVCKTKDNSNGVQTVKTEHSSLA